MDEDIVNRLRVLNFMGPWHEAANKIERLRLDNSNLRGSLQFIAMANPLDGQTWEKHSREIKDYAIKELEWKEPE